VTDQPIPDGPLHALLAEFSQPDLVASALTPSRHTRQRVCPECGGSVSTANGGILVEHAVQRIRTGPDGQAEEHDDPKAVRCDGAGMVSFERPVPRPIAADALPLRAGEAA
jgi:hypothetical protein